MNVKEIRSKSNEELNKEMTSLKEELFNLRFQQATGQLENPSRMKEIKKTIARIKTIITERVSEVQRQEDIVMERAKRKVLRGTVVSDKMDKTVTVEITTQKKHPLYSKRVKYTKKYKAHDELNEAKMGDTVLIMETRPLSATKRFRLVKIIEKAVIL